MRFKKTIIGAFVVAAAASVVTPVEAGKGEARNDGSAAVYEALERDLGWSRDHADRVGKQQAAATTLEQKVQRRLGAAYAGSYFDDESGRLVVNSTTKKGVATAKELGASARLVEHGLGELEEIKARLDESAGGAADAVKRSKPRGESNNGLAAWSVDPITNSVLVSVTEKQAEVAKKDLADFGDAVTVEVIESAPETAANWMDGGDAINGSSCSAGFNLRNKSTGAKYLLTAGHCVNAGSNLTGQGGVSFGTVLESWFPSYDDAIVRNQNTGYWIQGPWVDTNPSNGGFITTSGFTDGLVGTTVCKSGITTKWTCGKITAKNQTVNYSGGQTVYGLTRHNACVEPGDSGGANVAVYGSTRRAEGVTSGASMIDWGGKKRCIGSIFGWLGLQSTSWYFPIADSLAYYGPKYGVSTW